MAQVGWVYLDQQGGRHRIGVYHGDQSGHLVIHCNRRVVQIDFSVKENKTYSFFVEDELCEVSVHKEKQGFSYDFQVNKTVDTPMNRLRKRIARKNLIYMLLLIGGLAVLLTGTLFGLRAYQDYLNAKRFPGPIPIEQVSVTTLAALRKEGLASTAKLYLVKDGKRREIFYGFSTSAGQRVSGRFPVDQKGDVLLPNGFPLKDNDAFAVRYMPEAPDTHYIDFFQPSKNTKDAYLERAIAAQLAFQPNQSASYVRCIVEVVREKRGWKGLAHFIFQQADPKENKQYNSEAYMRLMRSADISKAITEACWNQ